MITLTFWELSNESMTFVRGAYFRICADATLRGPDNAVAARYVGGLWQVARRNHRVLECRAALYLRVTGADGQRKSLGPFEGLKVTGGDRLSRHPNRGTLDDQEAPVIICSRDCLRAFAANVTGPDRTSSPKNSGSG